MDILLSRSNGLIEHIDVIVRDRCCPEGLPFFLILRRMFPKGACWEQRRSTELTAPVLIFAILKHMCEAHSFMYPIYPVMMLSSAAV